MSVISYSPVVVKNMLFLVVVGLLLVYSERLMSRVCILETFAGIEFIFEYDI